TRKELSLERGTGNLTMRPVRFWDASLRKRTDDLGSSPSYLRNLQRNRVWNFTRIRSAHELATNSYCRRSSACAGGAATVAQDRGFFNRGRCIARCRHGGRPET